MTFAALEDWEEFSVDGVHPTDLCCHHIARLWLPKIRELTGLHAPGI